MPEAYYAAANMVQQLTTEEKKRLLTYLEMLVEAEEAEEIEDE